MQKCVGCGQYWPCTDSQRKDISAVARAQHGPGPVNKGYRMRYGTVCYVPRRALDVAKTLWIRFEELSDERHTGFAQCLLIDKSRCTTGKNATFDSLSAYQGLLRDYPSEVYQVANDPLHFQRETQLLVELPMSTSLERKLELLEMGYAYDLKLYQQFENEAVERAWLGHGRRDLYTLANNLNTRITHHDADKIMAQLRGIAGFITWEGVTPHFHFDGPVASTTISEYIKKNYKLVNY